MIFFRSTNFTFFLASLGLLFLPSLGKAFSDISSSDPHFHQLSHLHEIGVMKASNNIFRPDSFLTRAEGLTVAMRAGSIWIDPDFAGETYYQDVDPNQWYAPVVARAVETGILRNPEGAFRSQDPISKAEFLALLIRATQTNLRPYLNTKKVATDIPDDSWATAYFAYAKRFGIFNPNSENAFSPGQSLTRREAGVATYNQLRLFHGSSENAMVAELQAAITQFLQLINRGHIDQAEFYVHHILKLNQKVLRSHRSSDTVAASALSRSMDHLNTSLKQFRYGRNLRAIEELHLALKQASRAESKSEAMAPLAQELRHLIEQTLISFVQPQGSRWAGN